MELYAAGWDCNVYRIGQGLLWKSYDKRCLGVHLEHRKNPAEAIQNIAIAEPVYSFNASGFATEYMPIKLGTFSRVNGEAVKEIGLNKFNTFISEIGHLNSKGIVHQDICPDHIRYNEKEERWVLIDWTHMNTSPNINAFFFNDDWVRWRLSLLATELSSKKDEILPWFQNVGVMPLYWMCGNLCRWIFTSEKKNLKSIFELFLLILKQKFFKIHNLADFLLTNLPFKYHEIVDCLYSISIDPVYNWIVNYGEFHVVDIMRRGLCAHVYHENDTQLKSVWKRLPLFEKSETILVNKKDYNG